MYQISKSVDGDGSAAGDGDGAVSVDGDGAVSGNDDGAISGNEDGAISGDGYGAISGNWDGVISEDGDGAAENWEGAAKGYMDVAYSIPGAWAATRIGASVVTGNRGGTASWYGDTDVAVTGNGDGNCRGSEGGSFDRLCGT